MKGQNMHDHHLRTGFAAAETIARRLPILWGEMIMPTRAGQAEVLRMVAEKQQAFVSGVLAAQMQLAEEAMRFWFNPFAAYSAPHGARRVADASMRPAAHKVRANARRLRRGQ